MFPVASHPDHIIRDHMELLLVHMTGSSDSQIGGKTLSVRLPPPFDVTLVDIPDMSYHGEALRIL